ncbi:MAG: hypothetical protein L3K06_01090 [Thermoplasmata archaeon]|nr:hypothetical protein [Thermoplasmata archaeon]
MPVTALSNLPLRIARAIELGPLDYQRKLGEALPTCPRPTPVPVVGAIAGPVP